MDGIEAPPQHELPRPQQESGGLANDLRNEKFGHITPELMVAPMPGEGLVQANNAVSQAISGVPAIPIQQVPVNDDGTTQQTAGPAIADDNDVIEKEWVDKAKQIVARTQGDPHAKSNELTGLKKEYRQKRYGRTVATPTDNTTKV